MAQQDGTDRTDNCEYQEHRIYWCGIAITIRCCPNWLNTGWSHLEAQSSDLTRLPITETGYRSHFMPPEELAEWDDDPVSFVTDWLNHDAQLSAWQEHERANRQRSLFQD